MTGRELSQHELEMLVGQERGAEGTPLAQVVPGPGQRKLYGADLLVEGDQALRLELRHLLLEAATDLADGVGHGDAHVGERELGRVARPHPELLQFAGDGDPLERGRHDDERHAASARLVRGTRQQAEPVRLRAVGDEELGTVDHPLVPVSDGPGADAGHVTPGVGLGDGDGRDHLAPDGRREVGLLELGRPVARQGGRRHGHLHRDGHRHPAAADPSELLPGDHGEGVVRRHAAVGLLVLEAEQAESGQLREELVGGEGAGGLPLVDVRLYLALEHVTQRLAEELVLVGLCHRSTVPPRISGTPRFPWLD